MKYCSSTGTVNAIQWHHIGELTRIVTPGKTPYSGTITTAAGVVSISGGDWILTDEDGAVSVMDHNTFRGAYKPVFFIGQRLQFRGTTSEHKVVSVSPGSIGIVEVGAEDQTPSMRNPEEAAQLFEELP